MERDDEVWRKDRFARAFLDGVRGGIPHAGTQFDVMLELSKALDNGVGNFLDIGCGNGVLSSALLSRWPGAIGTLVDFSSLMLKEARKNLKGYGDALSFKKADFGKSEWIKGVKPRAPFDLVASGFAIHHQPDRSKRRIYRQVLSLLRPGGLFVNIDHVAPSSKWGSAIAESIFSDALIRYQSKAGIAGNRRKNVEKFLERPERDRHVFSTVEVQCGWLRDLGFTDVDCYFKFFELAVFAGRRPGPVKAR